MQALNRWTLHSERKGDQLSALIDSLTPTPLRPSYERGAPVHVNPETPNNERREEGGRAIVREEGGSAVEP